MNTKQVYVLAKNYVNESLDGAGALKGAPCKIKSITPSTDGTHTTVTFEWESNSGTVYESELQVINGESGMGIKGARIDSGHLILIYDDDTEQDVADLPVKTVEVGDTETVEYDEDAEVTQEVTATGIKLNFKIPRGEPGGSDPIWHNV